jgi:hypothetical protein
MLVVKIELHNANTGRISEIGRMQIANVGGTDEVGDYAIDLSSEGFAGSKDVRKSGRVENYPRLIAPIWSLVSKALHSVGF